jgi:hypothetical protein
MIAKGTFEITMQGEPPYEEVDGVSFGRASFDKRFTGPLSGTGKVQMLAARTPIENSGAYVALERITGTLDGKPGSFATVHMGIMTRGTRSLTLTIVPDSGTGDLKGIAGRMDIHVVDGKHHYEVDYTLA